MYSYDILTCLYIYFI